MPDHASSETGASSTGGEIPDLEAIALRAADTGARLVRQEARDLGTVRTKSSPTDPVTSLDLRAEGVIRRVLESETPGASVQGEEDGDVMGRTRIGWIIDPIDGTVNLTYDLPVLSVSVAATLDGNVVAGAVIDVLREESFSAAAGAGARRDGDAIEPSPVQTLDHALIGTGFAYRAHRRAMEAQVLDRVLPAARDIRCFGSAALNLCWVASGRLDGFYQRHMRPWDYAAGALIAAEAGARVEQQRPDEGDLMVATSPLIFEALSSLVA